MTENKRYYWFKMKKEFFDSKALKYILSLENGRVLAIVLIKIMLSALEEGGFVRKENVYLTFEQEIAMSISESEEDVRELLEIAQNLNLIEKVDDETYSIKILSDNIGSETDYAVKKRNSRKKDNVETMSGQCPTDIEKEKEIDTDIEKEKEKSTSSFSKKKGDVVNEKNNFFKNNNSRFGAGGKISAYNQNSKTNSRKPSSYDIDEVLNEVESKELIYVPKKRNPESRLE